MTIRFFLHHVHYKIKRKRIIKTCIGKILADHNKKIGEINIIITNDSEILSINRKFLQRRDYTDIITFNFSEKEKISGELYISIERVKENSITFKVKKDNELLRVIFHGILHLVGYDDETEKEKKQMRKREDLYIEHFYKNGSDNL